MNSRNDSQFRVSTSKPKYFKQAASAKNNDAYGAVIIVVLGLFEIAIQSAIKPGSGLIPCFIGLFIGCFIVFVFSAIVEMWSKAATKRELVVSRRADTNAKVFSNLEDFLTNRLWLMALFMILGFVVAGVLWH